MSIRMLPACFPPINTMVVCDSTWLPHSYLDRSHFPQAVSSGHIVGLGQRGKVEHRSPEVIDRAPLAHDYLHNTNRRKKKRKTKCTVQLRTLLKVYNATDAIKLGDEPRER